MMQNNDAMKQLLLTKQSQSQCTSLPLKSVSDDIPKGRYTDEWLEQALVKTNIETLGSAVLGGIKYFYVHCPNEAQHTVDGDGHEVKVYIYNGWPCFKCHHAHCTDLKFSDYVKAVNLIDPETGEIVHQRSAEDDAARASKIMLLHQIGVSGDPDDYTVTYGFNGEIKNVIDNSTGEIIYPSNADDTHDDRSLDDLKAEVNNYDISTFQSTVPYELIDSITDATKKGIIISVLRQKARSLKFSMADFERILKDREREQAERQRKLTELKQAADLQELERRRAIAVQLSNKEKDKLLAEMAQKYFEGIIPQIDFGMYDFTESGVSYFGDKGQVEVCKHPLFPTKRSINIETGAELMDISYRIDDVWKTVPLIDKEIISTSRTIPTLSKYGMDITSENAKEVVKYLSAMDHLNRREIPRAETINRLGWVKDRGFSPYIDGVTYDSGGAFSDIYSSVHTHGDFDEWKNAISVLLDNKQYIGARLILAASVASVLLYFVSPQSFNVHLWSPESGIGKTVSCMAGASIWGEPCTGAFMQSMNSTTVAFEQFATFCNNLPMFLDELEVSGKEEDLVKFIYQHGENSGKNRGAKRGGLQKKTSWLNIAITSGEHPLTTSTKEGVNNRVISIEIHGQAIPGDIGAFADTMRNNYGFAGKQIVERLWENKEIVSNVKRTFDNLVRKLRRTATGKQAQYGAMLLLGDTFLDILVFDGKYKDSRLTIDDLVPYLVTPQMLDINIKIQSWLCGFIASEDQHFYRQYGTEDSTTIYYSTSLSPCYGQKNLDGTVWLLKEVLQDELTKRLWNWRSFLRWCLEKQYILSNYRPENNKHYEVRRTLHGYTTSSEVIVFKPEMFQSNDSEQQTEIEL